MNRSEPGQNRKIAALRISRACRKSSPAFFYVNVPFLDMREKPNRAAKVISQTFYSEEIDILAHENQWSYIQTEDEYRGWVFATQDVIISKKEHVFHKRIARTWRCAVHVYHVPDTEWGPILTLPLGSMLEIVNDSGSRWLEVKLLDERLAFVQRGDIEIDPEIKTHDEMIQFALTLPPLPYTWGGRSSIFGFDCSGLVQMLYKLMGVILPRDSNQQIGCVGFAEVALDKLAPGDLIFFGKESGCVSHVCMSLGGVDFLHTSPRENKPWIRISKLTDPEWCGSQSSTSSYRVGRTLIQ